MKNYKLYMQWRSKMTKPFHLFLLFKLIFTGVQLLYNIVLASIARQSVSVIYINTSPFYGFPFHLEFPMLYSRFSPVILEKAMAPHSSTLAWKIPWMEEPGRLQPMGSLRVGRDWATSLSFFTFMHQRRKWQPTPVFLPGESQGWGSLVGCRLWGLTESETTEAT